MPIQLPKDTRAALLASCKRFAREELDLDLGDLKAGLLLDFCLKEVGPAVYNAAIADAARYLEDKAADLPAVHHEPEHAFWKR